MKLLAGLLSMFLFLSPAFAQVGKAASDASKMKKETTQQKKASKPAPKKAAKTAEKKADGSADWSQFQSSAKRDLKADEEKRRAKAAKK